jgi:hypothetical protein
MSFWNRLLSGILAAVLLSAPAFSQSSNGGSPPGPPINYGPQQYMIAASGTNMPWASANFVPSSGQYYRVTQDVKFSPDYTVSNCVFGYVAFSLSSSGAQEQDLGGNVTLLGATILVNGDRKKLSFNNGIGASITPGLTTGYVWSDPVYITMTPRTRMRILTFDNPGLSGFGLGNVTANPDLDMFVNEFSAAQLTQATATYNGGPRFTNFGGVDNGYGPSIVACQGGDGTQTTFVTGDSLVFGQGEVYPSGDIRGNHGLIPRLLDDTLGDQPGGPPRIPFALGAVPAIGNIQITSSTTFGHRGNFLTGIPGQAAPPFTVITNELGTNDFNTVVATWEGYLSTSIGVQKGWFPGLRFVQWGWPPRYTQCDLTYLCAPGGTETTAAQFGWPAGNSPTVQAAIANKQLNGGAAINNADYFVNVDQFFSNSNFGGAPGFWRTDYSTYTSVLATAVTAAVTPTGCPTAACIQVLYPPPQRGNSIVLEPGVAGGARAEAFLVYSVTPGVGPSYPYTVALQSTGEGSIQFAFSHAVGATVGTSPTGEGIHSGSILNAAVADMAASMVKTGPGAPYQ